MIMLSIPSKKFEYGFILLKYIIKDAGHNGSYQMDPQNYFIELNKFIKSCK